MDVRVLHKYNIDNVKRYLGATKAEMEEHDLVVASNRQYRIVDLDTVKRKIEANRKARTTSIGPIPIEEGA